jgi:hypothetical protein
MAVQGRTSPCRFCFLASGAAVVRLFVDVELSERGAGAIFSSAVRACLVVYEASRSTNGRWRLVLGGGRLPDGSNAQMALGGGRLPDGSSAQMALGGGRLPDGSNAQMALGGAGASQMAATHRCSLEAGTSRMAETPG